MLKTWMLVATLSCFLLMAIAFTGSIAQEKAAKNEVLRQELL